MTTGALGMAFVASPSLAATSSYSIFTGVSTASAVLDQDDRDVELGLRFVPQRSGVLTAVKFLKAPGDVSTRSVTVWDKSGRVLGTAQSVNETGSGWQSVALKSGVRLRGGREYVVSYRARRYLTTEGHFSRTSTVGPLRVPGGTNGVYSYGGGFPRSSWHSSNYWVDVEFATTPGWWPPLLGTPSAAPVVTPSVPAAPLPTQTATTPPAVSTSVPVSTPSTSAPAAPAAAQGSLNLPRVAWNGGPAYYGKFAKAKARGWADPGFFPIAVFFGKPGHAAALSSVGVNTYMGAEHDGSKISTITRQGLSVLAQGEWSTSELGNDPGVVGYHVSDECDMGLGCSGTTAAANLADQKQSAAEFRGRNDGRFLQANFGNGVLDTYWAKGTMSDLVKTVDVASVDKYAYTSPHVQDLIPTSPHWPSGASVATSGAYGWLSDRLASYAPVQQTASWVFVETGRPYLTESGSKVIKPEQIEGAVWSALIHEARGIAYFQHSNDPTCQNYSLVECDQARKDKVKQVNAQVKSLAPVLNSQSYVWNFGAGVDTMLKVHGGNAYIFSGVGLKQSTGAKTFTLPAGVSGGTVTVVDENRTIPVKNGKFTDTFASEYTHHIYKVALS